MHKKETAYGKILEFLDGLADIPFPKELEYCKSEECELKNIATYQEGHGHGYGSKLLNHIFLHYKEKYKTMLVGTGDSPWILHFYQKNGFAISHRIENFFTDNYDHPMFEDGVQLIDMVYLSKDL